MYRIIQHTVFRGQLLWPNIIFPGAVPGECVPGPARQSFIEPSDSCFCGWATSCLFVHLSLEGHWVVSTFWLLWIMLLQAYLYEILYTHKFSFLLEIHIGVELLGHIVTLYLTLWVTARLFPKAAAPFSTPSAVVYESSSLSTLSSAGAHSCRLLIVAS